MNDVKQTFFSETSVSFVPERNSFNAIRLLCALIVLYEHCVVLSGSALPCLNLRGIAVNVFFVLSGFWVTVSYLRCRSLNEYAGKRFKKIFPQYWIVVAVCSIGLCTFSVLPLGEYFSDSGFFKYVASNFLTLNFIHPCLPGVFEGLALGGSVNGSLWTIKVEIGFYILLPVVLFLMKKLNAVCSGGKNNGGGYGCIVLFVLYLLSVLYEVFMPYITEKTPLPSALNNQLPAFISYFTGGMSFALFGEWLFPKLKTAFVPSAILLVLVNVFKIPFISAFVSPACLSICVMFLALNLKVFSGAGSKADYSYGIYLVHYPLAMCFIQLGVFERKSGFAIFAVLGTSFLCAFLLEKLQKSLFEKNTGKLAVTGGGGKNG